MKLKAINRYIVTQSQADKDNTDDDYVTNTIGAFGYFQSFACGTAAAARCVTSWNTLIIVFLTSNTEFACTKFKDGVIRPLNSTCYEDCMEYQFYSEVLQDTLISSFGLICDKAWLASFTQTMTMFGLAVGVVVLGWFSDRFGRRLAFLTSIAFGFVFMIAASFASSYWLYNVFRFLAGVGSGGVMTLSVVYNMEMVGQKYREVAGTTALIADGFAYMIMAVVAYYSSTWQALLLTFGIVPIVMFILMLFMPETPRWLVSQKRKEEAIAIMTKIAQFNKLETSHIREVVSKAIEDLETAVTEVKKGSLLDLFSTKELAKVTVVYFLVWFTAGMCYFGIYHYATLLGLNIFLIVPLLGLFQIIGNFIAVPVNKYVGRRVSASCNLIIVAILMAILIFIPDGHWGCAVTTGLAIIFSLMEFCTAYVHVNECYPTSLRNMGIGVSCSGSKIGAMVAPFVANMQPHWISSTIFAVIPFVGAILCLLLPETKGKKFKDTLE